MTSIPRSSASFVAALALALLPALALQAAPPPSSSAARELSTAFKQAAQRVAPSVVSIRTKQVLRPFGGRTPGSPSSPLEDFFERFDGGIPRDDRGMVRRGAGSGFVVDHEGHLLTNYHVVANADEVEVAFSDGRQLDAKVLAFDEATDLAVLKIDRNSLPAAELGESGALEVGDWVIAVGNPFGLEQTVTAGIVSATGRGTLGLAAYGDFIQTDAAINPGNSGGPLLDLAGRVVGVNTAITTRTGAWNGIGFAIPIDLAREIMTSLIDEGRVARGYLGLLPQDLDEGLARSFGWSSSEGALVAQVIEDQPAERAGIRSEDIIVAIDERPVVSAESLRNIVALYKPGSKVRVKVMRADRRGELKERVLEVRLAERPDASAAAAGGGEQALDPSLDLGLTGRTLTEELADRLGLEPLSGVLVTDVQPGSAADDAGVLVRDLIVSVNGEAVSDLSGLKRTLRKIDASEGVRLKLMRAGNPRYVFIESTAD